MRAFVCLATCALVAAGCVTSNESYMADGRKGHVISCTPGWTGGIVGAVASASTNWGTCYQKAGEICGAKGYTVIHRSDEPGFAMHASQYGGHATTTNNRTLIVRCNEVVAGGQRKS